MTYGFAPLLPLMFFVPLLVVAALFIGYGLWRKIRGAWLRALALAALALAIANPSIFVELRDPLSTIVAIVVDRSQSQQNGDRTEQTDRAVEGLKARLAAIPLIEPRIVEARSDPASVSPATNLFTTLTTALSDVPPARIGGAIFVTDGQIHDVPDVSRKLGFDAPVHGLITGKPDEFDRRVELINPRVSASSAKSRSSRSGLSTTAPRPAGPRKSASASTATKSPGNGPSRAPTFPSASRLRAAATTCSNLRWMRFRAK